MNIIDAWIDEQSVKEMTNQLVSPVLTNAHSQNYTEDFAITQPVYTSSLLEPMHSDQTSLHNIQAAVDPLMVDQQQHIEQTSQTLVYQAAPEEQLVSYKDESVESTIPCSASEALQKAKDVATSSGILSGRFGNVPGIDEEKGWGINRPQLADIGDQKQEVLEQINSYFVDQQFTDEVCIVDRDGDVYLDNMQNPSWTNMTISASAPARELDIEGKPLAGYGHVYLKVNTRQVLQIIACSTSQGLLILGLLKNKPIASTDIVKVVETVRSYIG